MHVSLPLFGSSKLCMVLYQYGSLNYLIWFLILHGSLHFKVLHLIFQHDGGEHLQTGIHPQQLQGEMEGEVDQGEPGVVRQGKQERGL